MPAGPNVRWTNTPTEINTGSISSQQVCCLLRGIRRRCRKPVTVVLDNARYQHTASVREEAERLHIELLYLPPYSPNLNLIERVWKLVKKLALAARVLPTFDAFQDSIINTVYRLETVHRQEVASLMTNNFQDFGLCSTSNRVRYTTRSATFPNQNSPTNSAE